MNRRNFLASAAGAGVAVPAVSAASKTAILELAWLRLRNSKANQMQRATDFLAKGFVPAARRAGAGPMGFFSAVVAEESPFILALLGFPSLAAMEVMDEKRSADPEFAKAREEYDSPPDAGYMRLENSLLRGFDSMPGIEVPPSDPGRPARIFELRTYESKNGSTLRRKIKMFNDAEIAIFRKCGIAPVFFGQTLVGRNLPNLTYMVAFDDMAARDKAWRTFGDDPEWKKLSGMAEYSDPELVSNISNALLRPLPFSEIR